jgi:hypothetical protein
MTIADTARDNAIHCEAKKHAYRQTQDGVVVSFVLHPQEVPEGLATAPLGARYVLALVELNDDETPKEVMPSANDRTRTTDARPSPSRGTPEGAKRDWRDFQPAQQAGIRAGQPLFRAFLKEQQGYDCPTKDEAAYAIRDICGVESRAEIGPNHKALVIWHALDTKFQAWSAKERMGA